MKLKLVTNLSNTNALYCNHQVFSLLIKKELLTEQGGSNELAEEAFLKKIYSTLVDKKYDFPLYLSRIVDMGHGEYQILGSSHKNIFLETITLTQDTPETLQVKTIDHQYLPISLKVQLKHFHEQIKSLEAEFKRHHFVTPEQFQLTLLAEDNFHDEAIQAVFPVIKRLNKIDEHQAAAQDWLKLIEERINYFNEASPIDNQQIEKLKQEKQAINNELKLVQNIKKEISLKIKTWAESENREKKYLYAKKRLVRTLYYTIGEFYNSLEKHNKINFKDEINQHFKAKKALIQINANGHVPAIDSVYQAASQLSLQLIADEINFILKASIIQQQDVIQRIEHNIKSVITHLNRQGVACFHFSNKIIFRPIEINRISLEEIESFNQRIEEQLRAIPFRNLQQIEAACREIKKIKVDKINIQSFDTNHFRISDDYWVTIPDPLDDSITVNGIIIQLTPEQVDRIKEKRTQFEINKSKFNEQSADAWKTCQQVRNAYLEIYNVVLVNKELWLAQMRKANHANRKISSEIVILPVVPPSTKTQKIQAMLKAHPILTVLAVTGMSTMTGASVGATLSAVPVITTGIASVLPTLGLSLAPTVFAASVLAVSGAILGGLIGGLSAIVKMIAIAKKKPETAPSSPKTPDTDESNDEETCEFESAHCNNATYSNIFNRIPPNVHLRDQFQPPKGVTTLQQVTPSINIEKKQNDYSEENYSSLSCSC